MKRHGFAQGCAVGVSIREGQFTAELTTLNNLKLIRTKYISDTLHTRYNDNKPIICYLLLCLHQCAVGTMLKSHVILVTQRGKRKRFVSAKVWKKYNKVKLKRFGVDLTVDNELVDKKLQTLVGRENVFPRNVGSPFTWRYKNYYF
jgi:hypothetical protein